MDTDWAVWPIFLVELLAFFLLLFKVNRRFLKLSCRVWVHIILFSVCIGIVVSLSHDATTSLSLSF